MKVYLDSFPEPKDDVDRTIAHFLCRVGGKSELFKDVIGFCAIPFFLLLYWINGLFPVKSNKHRAILIHLTSLSYHTDDRFPEELKREFGEVYTAGFKRYPFRFRGILDAETFACWRNLFRRGRRYGFLCFFSLVSLASMNRLLKEYQPEAIINYRAESNYASSLLTCLCEQKGTEYICYMHGEYLNSGERAFVRFSRMYLWDEGYRDVFAWSRSADSRMYVYTPGVYRTKFEERDSFPYYLAYYFSGNDRCAEMIAEELSALVRRGLQCKVRPHPRFSDLALLKKAFEEKGIPVEDAKSIDIVDSINETEHVAALFSSVLTQAYYGGKKIVIDDVSAPEKFDELEERNCIILKKEYRLLSEMVSTKET